jgi:hypothetical protein
VAFGGYEPFTTNPPVCVRGELTAKSVALTVGGITREGAGLPSPGGQ